MVLVQKWPFFRPFFLSNLERENVFYHILERKNSFLRYKKKKFKKSKKCHFSNFFFLRNLRQENFFYDILERKNTFLRYKSKKFKNSKNWHFWQGVNPWFWSKKWPFFQFFFFRQLRPGKCLLGYSRTKKRLSTL